MFTTRVKLAISFAVVNLALLAVASTLWYNKAETPPLIQGVLLADSRPLQDFQLIDHNNRPFNNRDLLGSWHLVSYGFTTCPDVCPTTLSTLAQVAALLEAEGREPLTVLFYSVDHRRDTVTQLASYLPFFHRDFVGLTHLDDSDNSHLPFEQSLGIFARLTPMEDRDDGQFSDAYQVSHGVKLFLLNPEGQLQAIFNPGEDAAGIKVFSADKLYRDYLEIRRYHAQVSIASFTREH